MKKQIANIITSLRIVGSISMLFFSAFSVGFYVNYLFCGFTDMIDGLIARKTGTVSKFGAKLDTVADFVFVVVCSIKILPIIRITIWLWVWIIIVALIKILNIVFVFIQKKKLISIHSALNKITGFALFLFPFSFPFVENTYSVAVISILATIAVMQEVYFIAKGQEVL